MSMMSRKMIGKILLLWTGILTCFAQAVDATKHHRLVDILNDPKERFDGSSSRHSQSLQTRNKESDVQELYMTQKLDHFDPSSTATYQQRYFYTDRYVHTDDDDTVQKTFLFLCVGGEGPGFDQSVLVYSVHCSGDMIALADRLYHSYHVPISIHLFALEHRYYGKSYPEFHNEPPVTTEHLRYLSSRQGLEDLSHFVATQQARLLEGGSSTEILWIAFGGSYPGYMAGNSRMKYPHLIHAAVSNSAPLQLKVDFPEYKERVGWDLRYEKIGGSAECFDIVQSGHDEAIRILESKDRNRISKLAESFHVCQPNATFWEHRDNQNLFVGDGLINIDVQDNDPSCQGSLCNVQKLCSFMIGYKRNQQVRGANATDLDILVAVADKQRYWQKQEQVSDQKSMSKRRLGGSNNDVANFQVNDDDNCLQVDWAKTLEELSNLLSPTEAGAVGYGKPVPKWDFIKLARRMIVPLVGTIIWSIWIYKSVRPLTISQPNKSMRISQRRRTTTVDWIFVVPPGYYPSMVMSIHGPPWPFNRRPGTICRSNW